MPCLEEGQNKIIINRHFGALCLMTVVTKNGMTSRSSTHPPSYLKIHRHLQMLHLRGKSIYYHLLPREAMLRTHTHQT
jgi:hypothetical protein